MIKIYEGKQANSPKLYGLMIGIITTLIMLIIIMIIIFLIISKGLDSDDRLSTGIVLFSLALIFGFVMGIITISINSSNKKNIKFYGENGYIYYDDEVNVFRFHKENITSTKNIDIMRLVGRCDLFIKINYVEYKSFKTGEFIVRNKKLKLHIASGLKYKNKKEIIERIYEAERRSFK